VKQYALVTTTIRVPEALRFFRKLRGYAKFYIIGDEKSPHAEIEKFVADLRDCHYYSPEAQKALDFECSDLIGWNTISRRSIGLLLALRDCGNEVIIYWDDDNLSVDTEYFHNFMRLLDYDAAGMLPMPGVPPWYGLEARALGWFDPGEWMFPRDGIDPVVQRGIPQHLVRGGEIRQVVDARIGVAQGLILGDPDTSAVDRLSRSPIVHQISELYQAGIVVDPKHTRTVMNSQNTAFIRELAPAMFMLPGIGRYDDIFASLIAQRVMRERGYVTHFGKPFCWQQRNAHNLIADLKAEIFGMEHIVEFAEWLDGLDLSTTSVLDAVRGIYTLMSALDWMPQQAREAGLAWCEDVERVL
jgi:hypothetical protein